MSTTPESNITKQDDSAMMPTTMGKKDSLPMPNELIYQVLENLSPLDVFSVGSTCHHLRKVVNEQAKVLAEPIIKRELKRMDAGHVMSGVSLLDAIRSWMLHLGPNIEKTFHATALRIANSYVRENGINVRDTEYVQDHAFFTRLVEYLLHVNYLKHARAQGAETGDTRCPLTKSKRRHCHCLTCTPYRNIDRALCCWIEDNVLRFKDSEWENDFHPLDFWRRHSSPVTERLITADDWMEMILSILDDPLEDPTEEEKHHMSTGLLLNLAQGFHSILAPPKEIVDKFVRLAELPEPVESLSEVFIPRVDLVKERQSQEQRTGWGIGGETLGARAAKEFCSRKGQKENAAKKLLDPESRLLKAVMLQELRLATESDD